jgi:hypothetical protein
MKYVGYVASMVKRRGAYMVLVGKRDKKRPLGRRWHRRENNIKIDIQEIKLGVMWIDLAQDREKWRTCDHANEPSDSLKCGEFLD